MPRHSLADLIIDKVLINSASPIRIDTIPSSESLAMSVAVRGDRKRANERVGADEMR